MKGLNMLQRFILLLFCCSTISTIRPPETPTFASPIFLFKERNLITELNLIQKLKEQFPDMQMTEKFQSYLSTIITAHTISAATGRQVPEIGYDTQRKTTYTGALTQPSTIVMTFSGKETLQETVAALEKAKLAHNFFIDRDGSIHLAKHESESDDEALKHRPFALGIAAVVEDGFAEAHDMNSQAITIAAVGKDNAPATQAQTQAIIDLIAYLQKKYSIPATHVLDYGCVAVRANPVEDNVYKGLYGRRNTQPLLPWKELAEHKLAIWPRAQDNKNIDLADISNSNPTIWTSMALRKIGFLCPPTNNAAHPDMINALRTFQNHYQCDDKTGKITEQTVLYLNSVLVQHEEINPKLKDILPPPLSKC